MSIIQILKSCSVPTINMQIKRTVSVGQFRRFQHQGYSSRISNNFDTNSYERCLLFIHRTRPTYRPRAIPSHYGRQKRRRKCSGRHCSAKSETMYTVRALLNTFFFRTSCSLLDSPTAHPNLLT